MKKNIYLPLVVVLCLLIGIPSVSAESSVGPSPSLWDMRLQEESGASGQLGPEASPQLLGGGQELERAGGLKLEAVVGGYPAAVKVAGGLTYYGHGCLLTILDTSQDSPRALGELVLPEGVWDLEVAGPNLVAVSTREALRLIDVSRPALPVEIGAYYPPYFIGAVDVSNGYVYTADPQGMRIIDIRDPRAPTSVGLSTVGYGTAVQVVAGKAYLATGYGWLYVIDVSDPASPKELSRIFLGLSWLYDVAVCWPFAYVAAGGGTYVVDVSDPQNPSQVACVGNAGGVDREVVVSGDYAYVTATWGLQVIDIRDPRSPVVVTNYDLEGYAPHLAVENARIAYVADTRGLRLLDVTDPDRIRQLGWWNSPGLPSDIVAGRWAFVAGQYSGLHTVDLHRPPTAVGFWPTLRGSCALALHGQTAFVSSEGGLEVVDVRSPGDPQLLERIHGLGQIDGLVTFGDFIVAVGGDEEGGGGHLQIIEAASPYNLRGSCLIPKYAIGVTVDRRGYAYVAAGSGGMVVVDILDVDHPYVVGLYPTGLWVYQTALYQRGKHTYALLAASLKGLLVVDVTDPASPSLKGSWTGLPSVTCVAVKSKVRKAVVGGSDGLALLDLTNPAQPRTKASYETRNEVRDVAFARAGRILASVWWEGLLVFRRGRFATSLPLLAK